MADRQIVSLLLGLLSNLIACIQLYFMLLNLQAVYVRKRLNITRLFSMPVSRTRAIKRLNRRPATPRRFWVRPGRTSVSGAHILQALRMFQGHPTGRVPQNICSAVEIQLAGKLFIATDFGWELRTFSSISSRAGWIVQETEGDWKNTSVDTSC